MNNRYIELARQAGFDIEALLKPHPGGFPREDILALEAFTELIIADIDKIVDDLYHALPLEQAAVLLTLDEQIKGHFYAEEIEEDPTCPRCGAPDGGTSCGLPDCGLILGGYDED